jgi:transposase-like protein
MTSKMVYGFGCQRPAKRALERDEEKIERWKKKRWPKLKKKPNERGAR